MASSVRTWPRLDLGTARGLFRAEPDAHGLYTLRPLGALPPLPDGVTPQGSALQRQLSSAGLGAGDTAKGALLRDPREPRRLYVGTEAQGVYRSDDDGATWQSASQGLASLAVWSLAQHPVTGTLYAGTEPAAVYRSDDGGARWQACGSFAALPRHAEWTFPRPPHVAHVKHLALDPERPGLVVGAVEEGWLVRSDDGGRTWQSLRDGMEFDAHSAALVPGEPDVILATSGDGYYRSEDGGRHFARLRDGLTRSYLSPIAMSPLRPRTVYLAAARHPPPHWFRPGGDGADLAFYRSDDEGRHWRQLPGVEPLRGGSWATAVSLRDPDVFCAGLSDGSVWLTRDGGAHMDCVAEDLGLVSVVAVD